jgi:hypothetical protein
VAYRLKYVTGVADDGVAVDALDALVTEGEVRQGDVHGSLAQQERDAASSQIRG